MMLQKSYYNPVHFAESFQNLNDLRKSEENCDIYLLTSDKKIPAHKIVLASASEYFKDAINGFYYSGIIELEFWELKYETVSALVDYMYTGKIDINFENIYDIYNAANYYLMNFIKEICFDFLQENLDIHNSVQIWLVAYNCQREQLTIAARNFIYSNLEYVSYTKKFLSLSDEELLELLKFWPKQELYDTIINSVLNWAEDKDNVEETLFKILKDVPHTSITEDYLEQLSKNEFIQNSIRCKNLILNNLNKNIELRELEEAKTELRFSKFLYDLPIIFMDDSGNKFYRYSHRKGTFILSNKMIRDVDYRCSGCETYKNLIYVVGEHHCETIACDDLNRNRFESAFRHSHGYGLSSAVLNDSMYILGGKSSERKGTIIDLSTKRSTSFNLLYDRWNAGVAVSDGAIYICAGSGTHNVERFDPREGRTFQFQSMHFESAIINLYSATALSNKIYCANGYVYKMIDLRNNNNKWVTIDSPVTNGYAQCLVSSFGKVFTVNKGTICEYNNALEKWQAFGSYPELSSCHCATSFQ